MPHEYEVRLQFLENQLAETNRKLQQLQMEVGTGGYVGTLLSDDDSQGPVATVFHIPGGVVIAAGGSAIANVYQTINGVDSIFVTGATIYNKLAAATTAGHTLMVGANGDGTFKVISQSC